MDPISLRDGLSFDDILLKPKYSEIRPPEVNLNTNLTEDISLNIPFLSASMDKVTEAKTAVAMARLGGAGVIHRNLSVQRQALEVERVKKSESGMIQDPVTISPEDSVEKAWLLMKEHGISGLPVVFEGKLAGIITNRDLRFEENRKHPVSELMTPFEKLVTAKVGVGMEEARKSMHRHRVEKLPIIDEKRELKGLITIKDIVKTISHPLANRDSKGRLRAGAAVGIGQPGKERLDALVHSGVDFVVVDTAHGDSKDVVEMVRWAKKKYPNLPVIAGNVATAEGTLHLIEAGADGVKVGMGCGSICTTRVVAGVGIPQFSAILDCASVARKYKKTLIADGGIKYSGDAVKAFAAGADVVMIGSLFAGTEEAPGETVFYQGRTYKTYRGMGSLEAMKEGNRDRYGQMGVDSDSLVPEGIEGMVPLRGPLSSILTQLVGGVKAGLGYLGCANLGALRESAEFVKISSAGLKESHVHDVFVTKEAPNYRPNF